VLRLHSAITRRLHGDYTRLHAITLQLQVSLYYRTLVLNYYLVFYRYNIMSVGF